jgi:hypothetical protein
MLLDYYGSQTRTASQYLDLEVIDLLAYIQGAIYLPVQDPKGIQGNLNELTADEQYKISYKASYDLITAKEARAFEADNNHKDSIKKWGEIFGPDFPNYG